MATQLSNPPQFPEEEVSADVIGKDPSMSLQPDTEENSGVPAVESDEIIVEEVDCPDSKEAMEEEVVTEKDILNTLNVTTYDACIYVVGLEDGRLYLGTTLTKDLKRVLSELPYKTVSKPVVLPKKSRLDVAKYWYILAKQYGQENIMTMQNPSLFKKIFEKAQKEETTKIDGKIPKKKKLIFKKKTTTTQTQGGFFSKIQNIVTSCRKLIRWPFFQKE